LPPTSNIGSATDRDSRRLRRERPSTLKREFRIILAIALITSAIFVTIYIVAMASHIRRGSTAMKAVRLESVGHLYLRDVEKPTPGPDELLVKVEASGICGSDRHFLHGEFPCSPPVTLGHEFCGIIEDVGSAVVDFHPGMRITGDPNIACGRCAHCYAGRVNLCANLQAIGLHRDGGFAEYVLVPQKQAHSLPLSMRATHGAFCEPLSCCIHGVDLAEIKPGASVVVLGGGVIGMLTVQLARRAGAEKVVLSTRQAVRRALAEKTGATASVDPSTDDVVEKIAGANGVLPGGADVVIECAGVPDTMRQMTQLARRGGAVVVLGVMPQKAVVPFEPFDIFFRELRIFGSFINPFTHRRAAELIASGAIDVDCLITRQASLADVPDLIKEPPAAGEIKAMFVS
jgi:L-iditol 2-dehydrogenase